MQAVETSTLTRNYRDFVAVSSLNISVEYGEIFGMLGPNGAGKTTTVKMLTTLLPPSKGEARVGGFDVAKEKNKIRKIIGYLPQQLTSDDTLTGYENLLFYAKLYRLPRDQREQRIREALELVGLQDVAKAMVTTYSGGMKRRLELASVFVNRPKILFLDEPTLGLDPGSRSLIWNFLQKLREDLGTTIFLTTNYMDEADRLCDRVAIIDSGKVVVEGSPTELKKSVGGEVITLSIPNGSPVHCQYCKSPISEDYKYCDHCGKPNKPFSQTALVENLPVEFRKVERVGDSLKFYVERTSDDMIVTFRRFLDDLEAAGVDVSSVTIQKPSLDDVFTTYVHKSLAREPAMSGPKRMKQRAWVQRASRL